MATRPSQDRDRLQSSNRRDQLRVCHVITGFDTGGAERVLLQTVQRLDSVRFKPIVVSLRKRGLLSEQAERSGIETIHLDMGRRPGLGTVWRLAGIFRRRKIDIVHAYLYDASIASRVAGKWSGVPVVLTSTRASLGYLPAAAWWLDRLTARWCQRIIAVSRHTADFIVQVERIPAEKVVVVPNGVDLRRFAPRSRQSARAQWLVDEDAFVVASVGRLSSQKGHRFLLEALASLRGVIPHVVCIIAGEGPLRHTLEKRAGALGLAEVCRFVGELPSIETIYAAADVAVLASEYEGMPNAALEAMAMGCPVIATAVGGSPEVVRDSETGLLVPPSDAESLGRAIAVLAVNPETRRRMSERSREIAERFHGIETMIESVERLYAREWLLATGQTL